MAAVEHLGPQFDYSEYAEGDPELEEHEFAVRTLAHGTREDPYAESSYGDLPARHMQVDPSLADVTGGQTIERVRRARQGYRDNPESMPPVILVQRGTQGDRGRSSERDLPRYDVADGHHRLRAAMAERMQSIGAVVVQSPHTDSWRDWDEED